MYNLIRECSNNHEIHMLAFYRKSHYGSKAELQKAVSAMKEICEKVEVFEIPGEHNRLLWYFLLFFNIFSFLPYSAWIYASSKMRRAILQFLEGESYDVIEFGEIGLADYAKLAPRIPKVMAHQNVESQLLFRRMKYVGNWFSKCYLWLQSVKLRRFERSIAALFDYHTVVSDEDNKLLSEICPNARIAVIPNGVDTDYFKPTDDTMELKRLIYVGGMTWFPNYDATLYFIREILPLIRKEIPDIELHCIGRQIDNKFHDLARDDPALKIHGFVDDVRPLITKAAVFIVPLRIGGGTRLKIVDAMSLGKAIVSTSIGCEGIKVKDGKEIMIADKPRDFAEKVVRIINETDLRNNLMKNARKTAEVIYSWKKIGPSLLEIYEHSIQIKEEKKS